MPFRRRQRLPFSRPRSRRWLAALALCAAGALPLGCGYQLQFQGTETPTPAAAADASGALHVRTVGNATPAAAQGDAAPASLIDQMVHRYLDSAGSGTGGNTTAATAAQPAQAAQPAASPVAAQPAASSASTPLARYAGQAQPPLTAQSNAVLPPITAASVADSGAAQSDPNPTDAATPSPTPAPASVLSVTAARTLTVAAPQAAQPQVTAVSLAVTFATGDAATATPTKTATPAPTASPAPTSPPPPSAPRGPVIIFLQQGSNDFTYAGAPQPVSQALSSIAGLYSAVYYTPAGGTQTYVYRPGIDPALTISAGTWLRVVFTGPSGTRFAMFPAS